MSKILFLMAAGSAAISADSAAYRFPGADALNPDTVVLIQPYWDCVMAASMGLERSKESAEIVVKAAIEQCRERRLDLEAAIIVDTISDPKLKEMQFERLLEKFDKEIEGATLLTVVRIRAGKAN